MAGSVNKVILVGNLGADPEVRRLANGEPVVNVLPHLKPGKTNRAVSGAKKPSGMPLSFSTKALPKLPSNISKKARRFILKGSFRPANGKIKQVLIAIRPRSFCSATGVK
jgi:hypothetical protein